jgi:tetratricopeptide (TPR) repeat protein
MTSSSSNVSSIARRVGRAFEKGDYNACAALLEQAGTQSERDEEIELWAARLCAQLEDWTGLLESAVRHLEKHPFDSEFLKHKACALGHLERWQEAADAWAAAGSLIPSSVDPLRELAIARAHCAEYKLFEDSIAQLKGLPDHRGLAAAAQAALKGNVLGRAVELYRELFSRDAGRADQEVARYRVEDDPRGIAIVVVAAARKNGHADNGTAGLTDVLVRAGRQHERQEDRVEAYADYSAALLLAPADTKLPRARQRLLRELKAQASGQQAAGDLERARASYRDLLRCEPLDTVTLKHLLRILIDMNDLPFAARIAHCLAIAEPGSVNALAAAARAYDRSGEFTQALALWKEVLLLSPEHPQAQSGLLKIPTRMLAAGRTALAENRLAAACAAFAAVPSDTPQYDPARKRLQQTQRRVVAAMRIAYQEQRMSDVIALGQGMEPGGEPDRDIIRLMGRAAWQLHDYLAARDAFSRLASLDPDPASLLRLTRACIALKDWEGARKAVADLLAREPDHRDATSLKAQIDQALAT